MLLSTRDYTSYLLKTHEYCFQVTDGQTLTASRCAGPGEISSPKPVSYVVERSSHNDTRARDIVRMQTLKFCAVSHAYGSRRTSTFNSGDVNAKFKTWSDQMYRLSSIDPGSSKVILDLGTTNLHGSLHAMDSGIPRDLT